MASSTTSEVPNSTLEPTPAREERPAAVDILVCLPPMSNEARESSISAVMEAFPAESILIGVTEASTEPAGSQKVSTVAYESARCQSGWALTAADYVAAGNLLRKNPKSCVILLGSETPSVTLLRGLAASADVVVPRLHPGPSDGLVNSALLYPVTRALFGVDIRFPLPHNIALSQRAMERLTVEAQKEVATGATESLLWPVSIAATAGFSTRQTETGEQSLPSPHVLDFNKLFTDTIGSLFADLEGKAMFWQRGRYLGPARPAATAASPSTEEAAANVTSMVEGFRVAYANLLPIWSLVLPPQSLVALKRLASVPPHSFLFPPELWAKTVYDFALAFHSRTINRSHLVGALIPLYLGWAASHIRSAAGDAAQAERLVQETAAAFESEKAYFVSRWRWPDRFNP